MDVDLTALMRDPEWLHFIVWVKRLKLGFHPDTAGADYRPKLSPAEIADYDRAIAAVRRRCECDPYEVAVAVWQRFDLIPKSRPRPSPQP
jgi:hypothetical protein